MTSPRRTRTSNASKRPGLAVKSTPRRTSAEVKAEAKAKAAAKAAKKQAKQDQIERVAGFETEAMANEELMDATPRPNFAPKYCTRVESEGLESEDREVDGPDADGRTYVPGEADPDDESDDSARSVEATPVPARKAPAVAPRKASKPVPARKVSKQLDVIAESSEDESEPPLLKVMSKKRVMSVEDTDDDGIELLSKKSQGNAKAKAEAKAKALKAKAKAKAKATQNKKTASSESDTDSPPPKKAKVAQEDIGQQDTAEKSGKKKKASIREAIAAVQEQTAPIAEFDSNGGRVSEEWGETMAVKHTARGAVNNPKCFGDGTQWSRQRKENGDEGRKEGMVTDQSIANCGPVAVKRPNQNMTTNEMDHPDDNVTMYVTYPNLLTAIMLTLDPTTLFYWTISLDPAPKKMKYSVEAWVKSIPPNAKPASRAPSQANSTKTGKSSTTKRYSSTAPALTTGTSSHSVASVLTSAVTITSGPVKIKEDPDSIYMHDGAISDCEETAGVERAAAHASPIKGKKRLTSEALVTERKPRPADANKKVKNEHLPHGVDLQVWRRKFVPTFIMYIAQQDNPFEHNANAVSGALQKIWDAIFSEIPHTIVSSSPVYRLVIQRVSDSWRNPISSAAIALVLAFCNANPDLKNSNENRQLFASEYLEHLRFLYKVSDGDDVNKFKGAFRGPFILQTFAVHLDATKGAQKIRGLEDSRPYGGLAIATAAVERALKLIASGTITIEIVQQSKGPVPTIPKQMNQATGKASNQLTGFNEASWGARCLSYAKSAKKLSASRFDEIVALAAEYTKAAPNHEDEEVIEILDDDDIRANIIDHSSGSEGGDD